MFLWVGKLTINQGVKPVNC